MDEGLKGAFHQLPMLIVRAVVGESAAVGYAASLGHPGYDESLYETYVIGTKVILGDRYRVATVFGNPADYWQGPSAVREKLIVLWNKFRVEPHHTRIHFASDLARSFDFEFYKAINNAIKDEVNESEVFLYLSSSCSI